MKINFRRSDYVPEEKKEEHVLDKAVENSSSFNRPHIILSPTMVESVPIVRRGRRTSTRNMGPR